MIENATFPYETTLSKANVKTNRMGENLNLNSVYESSTESLFYIPATKMPIFILFISTWVLFECVFSMWVPLNADRYVRYQLQYLNILSKCQNNHTSCKEEAHT